MSLLRSLLAVVDRPAEAMRAVAARPRAWWLPAILLLAGMLTLSGVTLTDQVELANERSTQTIERIAENLPEEQAEAVRARSTEMTPARVMLTTFGVGFLIAAIGWALRGTIVHFSSMALGGTSVWSATFAATTWAMIPFFVRDLLQTGLYLVNRQLIADQGLSFLVSSGDWFADSRSLPYAALSQVDPFSLWHIVLLAIGIHVSTKVGRAGAAIMSIVVWAVFLGLKLIPVAIGGALTGGLMG